MSDYVDLGHELLNEFGGGEILSVRTANAMAASGLLKRWQDAIGLDEHEWMGVGGIGHVARNQIRRAKAWHAARGNVDLIPEPSAMEQVYEDPLQQYGAVLTAAMALHRPCAGLCPMTRLAFRMLAARGVDACPDDFWFQYTGFAEFRWHDGDSEHFGSSNRYVAMLVDTDGIEVKGSIPKTRDDYHRDKGKIDVSGLAIEDAVTLLAMLIGVVRRGDGGNNP